MIYSFGTLTLTASFFVIADAASTFIFYELFGDGMEIVCAVRDCILCRTADWCIPEL